MNSNLERNIEILSIDENFIRFKSKSSWALCLGANNDNSLPSKEFFLISKEVNFLKIKYLIPEYKDFPPNAFRENNYRDDSFDRLRFYQKEDVNFLSKLRRIGIFSEMRTGKTPISLVISKKWGVKSIIIVSPSIVQNHWFSSVEEWLSMPSFIITYLEREKRNFFYERIFSGDNLVIIISKDTLKADIDFIKKLSKKKKNKFDDFCVIVDEAHFLRNYKSLQSKSVYLLNSKFKIAITGTPVVNHNSDIFGILKFIYPENFKSYWNFVKEYFKIEELKTQKRTYVFKKVGDFLDENKKKKLFFLIKNFSVSRKQKDIISYLPKIIRYKEVISMPKEQEEIYFSFERSWREFKPIEILAKLKTITLFPEEFSYLLPNKFKKKPIFGAKINFILDFLNNLEKNSVLIFSTRSKTFIEPLFEIIKKVTKRKDIEMLIGNTKISDREKIIKLFQERKINILLCNISVSSIGIKLDAADTIIFADRSYSPADNEQAESRFIPTNIDEYNSGSKVKMIIDLICKNTIDEKIFELIKMKKNITDILRNNVNFFFDY